MNKEYYNYIKKNINLLNNEQRKLRHFIKLITYQVNKETINDIIMNNRRLLNYFYIQLEKHKNLKVSNHKKTNHYYSGINNYHAEDNFNINFNILKKYYIFVSLYSSNPIIGIDAPFTTYDDTYICYLVDTDTMVDLYLKIERKDIELESSMYPIEKNINKLKIKRDKIFNDIDEEYSDRFKELHIRERKLKQEISNLRFEKSLKKDNILEEQILVSERKKLEKETEKNHNKLKIYAKKLVKNKLRSDKMKNIYK